MPTILHSQIDASVNFVSDHVDGGKIEARYVRRASNHYIVYLSSHSGCKQACRFCHLTATGQTMMTPLTSNEILEQARVVRAYYRTQPEANMVHYNFMARGEPLLNWNVDSDLFDRLVQQSDTAVKIKVSTIFPEGVEEKDLLRRFNTPRAEIYYSIYSLDNSFRKRWLPKAKPVIEALTSLKKWQDQVGGKVVLHHALIDGENDTILDAYEIGNAVTEIGLKVGFNLVRYNPPNDKSKETSQEKIEAYLEALKLFIEPKKVQIIPRVGFDVSASCGMFVS